MANLPKYSELPTFPGSVERHAWGVWGENDQLGMINLLTPERVLRAAGLIKRGKVFNIEPSRAIPHPGRSDGEAFQHHINVRRTGRTDYVDHWDLHGGMGHLDSLRHMRYQRHGYYQGLQDEDLDGRTLLGIENWAQHGIVGRGVLLDLPQYFAKHGQTLDPLKTFRLKPDLMETMAEEAGFKFEPGDIMLLRTGWMDWYLSQSPEARGVTAGTVHAGEGGMECPGLDNSIETAAWLWDQQFSFFLSDNTALEAMRIEGSDFQHRRLLPMFGMGIGELFTFKELSDDCAQDGVYEMFVSLKPVNIPGACGSPAHAYVIK